MKGVRIFAIVILALAALFFIVPALLPASYHVQRDVQIKASLERVYGLVANVKEWSSWYPIYRKEPLAEYLYVGPVQEVGSMMSWRGLDIGEGQVTLTQVNPPFSVVMQKSISSPEMEVTSYLWTLQEAAPGTVHVTWAQTGELDYPLERWRGLFKSSAIGPTLETGLSQLKTVAELQPLEPPSAPLDPFPNAPSAAEPSDR